MIIPEKIELLLRGNSELHGAVTSNISDFEKWLEANQMVFFPGYTDHGVTHIESVMRGVEGLIREETWELLTPEDAAVCLLSVLLHDAAMHLTKDGFLLIISKSSTWQPTGRFYKSPMNWCNRWEDFLKEASRFDDDTLHNLFNNGDAVGRPPEDPLEWNEYHTRLIGEFIRRHHGVLAHEIALSGVPGPALPRLSLIGLPEWMPDLIGLVAHSHNLNLRSCVDYLPLNGRKEWRGVHAPYLMALLRIADYLEIQAPRAPRQTLQVRSLRSPLSQQEWMKHKAVFDIRLHENDPECLWVDTEPTDVKTFLALQKLFKDIQNELDATWTTIGEVYGADLELRNLGIRIRRLRSTLDDIDEFEKSVEYIPAHVRFTTSDAELLKLLVTPLYSNNPAYGIRELLQNSIDACLEREDFASRTKSPLPSMESLYDNAQVLITVEEEEDGNGWLTITDTGIGMTRKIISNYFLRAGASFRASEEWRELHEENGLSRILRIGRFGVGLLASYLIGDEIEVTTRHITQPKEKGIYFKCRIDTPEIEMRWTECPIGTTIKVRLSQTVVEDLLDAEKVGSNWDWYTGTHPRVVRRIKAHNVDGRDIRLTRDTFVDLPQSYIVPLINGELPLEWRRFEHPRFDDVHWTWNSNQGGPRLSYNNIMIASSSSAGLHNNVAPSLWSSYESRMGVPSSISTPFLNIFDKNSTLPLELNRTDLSERLEDIFGDKLIIDICRDAIAFLLVKSPEDVNTLISYFLKSLTSKAELKTNYLEHPAIRSHLYRYWLAWNNEGILLAEPEIILRSRASTLCFFFGVDGYSRSLSPNALKKVKPSQVNLIFGTSLLSDRFEPEGFYKSIQWWADLILDYEVDDDEKDSQSEFYRFRPYQQLKRDSAAMVVTEEIWMGSLQERYKNFGHLKLESNNLLIYTGNDNSWLDFDFINTLELNSQTDAVGFWKLNSSELLDFETGPLGQQWQKLIGNNAIPFDVSKRRSQLNKVYEELKDEVERWEKNNPAI